MFADIGSFVFSRDQQARFKSGELWREWSRAYPELFDDRDIQLAQSQGPSGTHFYEWLLFKSMIDDKLLKLVLDYETFGGTQCPDLFVYSPDKRDWFFCEVKGQGDRLSSAQKEYFGELGRVSGKPIKVVRFKEQKS